MSITIATTGVIQLVSVVSGALLARLLGVEGRGLLAAVILWPSVVAYVGDLGGPLAYVYLTALDRRNIPRLLGNAPFIVLVQSICLAALGVPLVLLAMRPYPGVVVLGAVFVVVYLPLNLGVRYLNAINQGAGAFALFNRVRIAVHGSYVAGVVVLFALHVNALGAVVAVILASNVIALLTAVRVYTLTPRAKLDLHFVSTIFGYGLRGHIGNLTPVDSMQLDLVAVVALLGPYSAGLYAVGSAAAMVVRSLGSALGLVALPSVASSATRESWIESSASIFRAALVLFATAAVVVTLLAGQLVPLIYGTRFSGAIPIVRVLVLGMVAASLRQVLADCLRGAGRPLAGTIAEVASWGAAVIGLLLLLPPFGALGAALAVSSSYVAALIVSITFAMKLGMSLRDLFAIGPADVKRSSAIIFGALALMRRRHVAATSGH